MTDGLYTIELLGGQARAQLAKTTAICESARRIHGLSRTATAALGRLLTATVMMGVQLKDAQSSLTCRVTGGGPLGTLLAVGKPDGTVKGYVDNPGVELPRSESGKLPVGDAVGRDGMLTVIKDLRLKEPYVGQVKLVSGELGEDFAAYFTVSEQTPSLVSLGVLVQDTVLAAGGLIVQMMPGASEAAIQSVEMSAGMFANLSATIQTYDLQGTMAQLLTHLEPRILETRDIRYACDCSRERVERALISLGQDELRAMIDEDHGADVACQFCRTNRHFTDAELEELLRAAKS